MNDEKSVKNIFTYQVVYVRLWKKSRIEIEEGWKCWSDQYWISIDLLKSSKKILNFWKRIKEILDINQWTCLVMMWKISISAQLRNDFLRIAKIEEKFEEEKIQGQIKEGKFWEGFFLRNKQQIFLKLNHSVFREDFLPPYYSYFWQNCFCNFIRLQRFYHFWQISGIKKKKCFKKFV